MMEFSKIYMNNAATSWPKAPTVSGAVKQALDNLPGAMHRGGLDDFDVFDAVRRKLAGVLGVSDPSRICLGSNATWGLNMAIGGFALKAGDTVVTTMAEHNSVLRPLYYRGQRDGIRVVFVPTDGSGRVDEGLWEKTVKETSPRLAVMTHVSNVTGAVQPVEAMAAAAKAAGAAVILDASQSAGLIPIKAEERQIDMVAFTGHKYLLGPQGTGGVWVRGSLEISPVLTGGTGIQSDSWTMPDDLPLHLEAGTGNEPSYHGLLAALQWAEDNPPDREVLQSRMDRLHEGLREAGADIISGNDPASSVVSFCLPGISCADVGYMLQAGCDIVCRTGLHCAPKVFSCLGVPETVRLSLSRFTTDDEVEAAVEAVKAIAAGDM